MTVARGQAVFWVLTGVALALWARAAPAGEEGVQPFRFAVYGGVCGNAKVHGQVVSHVAKFQPELVVLTGEVAPDSRDREGWGAFDEALGTLGEACRIHACPIEAKPTVAFLRRVGAPDGASGSNDHYAFDRKGVHFVVLNSARPTSRSDPQTRWLAEDLAEAAGRPILVFFHNPIFSIKGRDTHSFGRLYWHPLFVKHRVTAVISGAHHLYFRTVQDGVPYIITAGGGGILSRIDSRRSLLPTDVVVAFHHAVVFTVTPAELRGRVLDTEGRTRDEFVLTLRRPAPKPQPKPASATPAKP